MKSVAQRRIAFLNQTRSDRWIAANTGIPRSSIGFIRRGERKATVEYNRLLRNVYQREGYARMTETGFSPTQARRFSRYAAESVGLKISEMKLLVNKFTTGAVGAKEAMLHREGISYDLDKLWDEMKQKVIEGLRKSLHPVEDFPEPDY